MGKGRPEASEPPATPATAVPEVQPGVRCPTGKARFTSAGDLKARHVIHTAAPVYTFSEESGPLLESSYRSCLALANEHKLKSVAFPAISCGALQFPADEAAEIAISVCQQAAGGVEEVTFYLRDPAVRVVFAARAEAVLERLPAEPALQSHSLGRLMRAAGQNRRQEVLRLLQEWALAIQSGSREGQLVTAGPTDAEDHSPGSLSPSDRGVSTSLQQHGWQQHGSGGSDGAGVSGASTSQTAGTSSSSGSGSGIPGAVDIRKWSFSYSELKKLKRLGSGSFGEVWMVRHNSTTFALKELFSGRDAAAGKTAQLSLSHPDLASFRREAELLASLRHPHLLAFMGVCLDRPAILMEYCTVGSLYDIMKAARSGDTDSIKQLSWLRRLALLAGVAKGMLALHCHNPPVIHRDLRSPNVLIHQSWVAKVADFGLSKFADNSAPSHLSSSVAGNRNPRWLAPEVLHEMMQSGKHPASKESDVYSFSQVMYEVLTWQQPWMGVIDYAVMGRVTYGMRPAVPPREELPGRDTPTFVGLDAYLALMRRCWDQAPESRPSFGDIVDELTKMLEEQQAACRAAAHAAHNEPVGPDPQRCQPGLGRPAWEQVGMGADKNRSPAGATPSDSDAVQCSIS